MNKNYNEVIGLSNTLASISRDRWPFNLTIAKNMKALDTVILEYNKQREEIIDKYAMRDSEGKILGVEMPVKGKLAPGEEPKMERIQNPTRIDETAWTDRAAFDKELKELNEKTVDFTLAPVDAKKVFLDNKTGRETTVEEFLDNGGMEPGMIVFLHEFGFFTNLTLA
jgi:hypothetical protein